MKHPDYEKNVFINCPFDRSYDRFFRAIVFTLLCVEMKPRSARVRTASEMRVKKICELIHQSKYGIHDISRTQLDKKSGLPRFNMPFELGLDLGCKEFSEDHKDKVLLVTEARKYSYQKFLSDILGYDPHAHGNRLDKLIQIASDWIRSELDDPDLPNGKQIHVDYLDFEIAYKEAKKTLPKEPAFLDLVHLAAKWINRTNKEREENLREQVD